MPGAFFVDIFPVMNLLPPWLAKWKRDGMKWHENETDMFLKLNEEVKEKKVCENDDARVFQ